MSSYVIPYCDQGHKDGFPILIDFSGIAVDCPENPGFPYRDANWMLGVFQRAWEYIAQAQYARLVTYYPNFQREGRYILPGGMIRVNVVPNIPWANNMGGYTPQPLDRWMHWYQSCETFVSLSNRDVGTTIVHELGHVIFSSISGSPMHTDKAGTIFGDTMPDNPTIDGPYTANAWGAAFYNCYAGVRWNDQGQQVSLPMPPPLT